MEISSDYTNLFEDIALSQVNEIKKAVIMEELGMKIATASMVADDMAASLVYGGYEPDEVIPEDSTISFHV